MANHRSPKTLLSSKSDFASLVLKILFAFAHGHAGPFWSCNVMCIHNRTYFKGKARTKNKTTTNIINNHFSLFCSFFPLPFILFLTPFLFSSLHNSFRFPIRASPLGANGFVFVNNLKSIPNFQLVYCI